MALRTIKRRKTMNVVTVIVAAAGTARNAMSMKNEYFPFVAVTTVAKSTPDVFRVRSISESQL
jgi:hypothetical protein